MTDSDEIPALPAMGNSKRERPIAPMPGRAFHSHQVNPDSSITFRFDAPNARQIDLVTDIQRMAFPLIKDAEGLWNVTTPVLPPALYAYAFMVDGVDQPDPRNPWWKPNLISNASMVLIPGNRAEPWEPAPLPHGTVHSHIYTTAMVEGLPANQSRYLVYTPPEYSAQTQVQYPVLYLLHGWSDSETAWTQVGRAHLILDALIASGKAKPMLVVMPLGYGQMSFVESGFGVWQHPAAIAENLRCFRLALLGEILPRVEAAYNVRADSSGRAIAGNSMGGLEAMMIGLNCAGLNGREQSHLFDWIGGFSSALTRVDPQQEPQLWPNLDRAVRSLQSLWMTCGIEDPLLASNRKTGTWMIEQGLPVTAMESAGGHTWPVWRNNLVQFVQLIF